MKITVMIQNIQQETGNAVGTMEHGNVLMQEGLSRNADVASALARIDEQRPRGRSAVRRDRHRHPGGQQHHDVARQ